MTCVRAIAIAVLVAASAMSQIERATAAETARKGDRMAERSEMVKHQIEARGVRDARVLEAMRSVPRHEFVPQSALSRAYSDQPLPIGNRQTISQPYIVAAMSELLRLEPGDKVLEVGTGSGYQAAVLSKLVSQVYSIEIIPELAESSKALLARLGFENVAVITGDGYRGLPELAPFDGIIVTAAPEKVPEPLIEQLAVGGRLVIPVGRHFQELKVLEKTAEGVRSETAFGVRFVPMTGEAQQTDGP
jgi:protein-L-isoaspartate(D-aspartate) O-methyltransferase